MVFHKKYHLSTTANGSTSRKFEVPTAKDVLYLKFSGFLQLEISVPNIYPLSLAYTILLIVHVYDLSTFINICRTAFTWGGGEGYT